MLWHIDSDGPSSILWTNYQFRIQFVSIVQMLVGFLNGRMDGFARTCVFIYLFIYLLYGFINRCNIKIMCTCWIMCIGNAILWSKSYYILQWTVHWARFRFNISWKIIIMKIITCICLWISSYIGRASQCWNLNLISTTNYSLSVWQLQIDMFDLKFPRIKLLRWFQNCFDWLVTNKTVCNLEFMTIIRKENINSSPVYSLNFRNIFMARALEN